MPEEATPEETPAEEFERKAQLIQRLAADATISTEDGPILDFDLLMKMLVTRAIGFRVLNRDALLGELHFIRDEHHTQQVRGDPAGDAAASEKLEARKRVTALEAREKLILDQLWPID